MRSIWKGAISFGLVSIPVKLYSATEEKDISFRQVHRDVAIGADATYGTGNPTNAARGNSTPA